MLAHVELLCLKKNDFDLILKSTVKQQWQEVQNAMSTFTYFEDWDEIAIRECCILSKMKVYVPDQTVFGDGVGLRDFVYFILKGKCRVVEHLCVTSEIRNGKKIYRLYDPVSLTAEASAEIKQDLSKSAAEEGITSQASISSQHLENKISTTTADSKYKALQNKDMKNIKSKEQVTTIETKRSTNSSVKDSRTGTEGSLGSVQPIMDFKTTSAAPRMSSGKELPPQVETHFMQVCYLNPTACFGIGENMQHRRIVTTTFTECLLIPRYWLLQKNKGNLWNRVQQFLNNHIPTRKQVFREFVNNRKWLDHRQKIVKDILSQRKMTHGNSSANVPYFIRITESLDD